MSHLSYSYAAPAGSSHRHAARHAAARAQSTNEAARPHKHVRGGYMLVHGGRQVRVGPIVFWIVVGSLVIMAVWTIATGTYFAFHDNVLARLIGRQAEIQFAYEDRIAELRAQIDRITSRQLLDQEQFEQKLNLLLQRQEKLEHHSSLLENDGLTTGSIRGGRERQATLLRRLRPSPISGAVVFSTTPADEAAPAGIPPAAATAAAANLDGMLNRVSASLDKVERRQETKLASLETAYDDKANRIRTVLGGLGINPAKIRVHVAAGGPFVPVRPPRANASEFERQLYHVNLAHAELAQYTQALAAIPVRKPVAGEIDMSSPFGMRLDPFLGRPAIHTGIDLRGELGEPVHATATGRVTIAGRDGGYGNMVEIDHGNGLATRYGHLSKIDVKVGQTVRIGEVIGRIGSTGRSTGPHLHYETRINGEAVNPQRFLSAGIKLGNAL